MDIQRVYGLSTKLFVAPKSSTQSLVVGGIGEDASRWTRVVSLRAAQILWFHLTQFLFPDKASSVTAVVHTAPARSNEMPTITSHITVDHLDTHHYEITGWVNDQTWVARLTSTEAQRLWQALDQTLYPAGWNTLTKND
ncbi:MAG: hypothetical protein IT320_19695 [Anaerolineae bacterium]|nr:hypothetical protein [Anaerolineae bacterium]